VNFIREYGNTDGFNSFYNKIIYKYLVKIFYERINKRENFEE